MKKFALAGMSIFLALLFVTCELGPVLEDEGPARTNVIVSADGSQVTIYFDETFPVTDSQRAINKQLAMMSYDYLEAVFTYGSPGSAGATVARVAWELGQSAGISGVYRTTTNISYQSTTPAASAGAACIFVGRKADKSLLGVGSLTHVNDTAGFNINNDTRSVTFTVTAFHTDLRLETTGLVRTANPTFITGAGGSPATGAPSAGSTTALNTTLAGTTYPIYILPDPKDPANSTKFGTAAFGTVQAKYTIHSWDGSLSTPAIAAYPTLPLAGIRQNANAVFTKREPRYLEGGRYTYIKSNIDTATTFLITSSHYVSAGWTTGTLIAFNPEIEMSFTTTANSSGIFSILFRIPVINMTTAASTNGQPGFEQWSIRPGYGSNLYNIDDGLGLGGCVLLSIGNTALDWIEIKLNEAGDIYFM